MACTVHSGLMHCNEGCKSDTITLYLNRADSIDEVALTLLRDIDRSKITSRLAAVSQ
jgi:hypothetical protein